MTSGYNSHISSAAPTRHVSPSVMFGGVEALVQEQEWWFRDQNNLALGFENWGERFGGSALDGFVSGVHGNEKVKKEDAERDTGVEGFDRENASNGWY